MKTHRRRASLNPVWEKVVEFLSYPIQHFDKHIVDLGDSPPDRFEDFDNAFPVQRQY